MRTDHRNSRNGLCVAVIGQMTLTMKAQNLLRMAAIDARLVKADSLHYNKGCAYALSFPCSQEQNLRQVLKDAGIRLRATYPSEN